MKKAIILSLAIGLITGNYLIAQSGLLNKVSNTVTKDVLGKPKQPIRQNPNPNHMCQRSG